MKASRPSHAPMIVSAEERNEMIRVAAYFLAEQRGFTPGGANDDWLRAEQQIDRLLSTIRSQGVSRRQFERLGLRNALRFWETS